MNNQMLDQAIGALNQFGATDALMGMLYQNNPNVRRIVDQNRGRGIDNLLRDYGVDPDMARRKLGIN